MAHSPFRPDKRPLCHVRRHCGQLWSAIVFRPGRAKFYQAEVEPLWKTIPPRCIGSTRKREGANRWTDPRRRPWGVSGDSRVAGLLASAKPTTRRLHGIQALLESGDSIKNHMAGFLNLCFEVCFEVRDFFLKVCNLFGVCCL